RLLRHNRHLVWRGAHAYKPVVVDVLAEVIHGHSSPEARFLDQLPREHWGEGLALLRAIWRARNNHELMAAVGGVAGARSAETKAAVAAVVDDPTFVAGLRASCFEEADQGHIGLVVFALAASHPLATLLATTDVLSPLAADLLAMAKRVRSPVSDAL